MAHRPGGGRVKLFDVAAARAEIEGRPRATSAIRAIPSPPSSTNSTNSTPPTPAAAPQLDSEGLPFAACHVCGGGLFWKPASLPFAGPGWACEACHPPPADLWRHACAVPVGCAP
jgi:hypothetical protein